MKFGKIFRHTVETRMPQWSDHCINYKALKQAIKQGTHRAEDAAREFTLLLDQHVEVVNNFYMERIEEGVIILHALHHHGEKVRSGNGKPEHRTACQRSLVSIHFQLLLLQNYVALNFTGITKILKKFEKRFEIPIRNDYIGAIVELPFYRCDALGDLVEETERQFNALATLGGTPDIPPADAAQAEQAAAAARAAMPPPGTLPATVPTLQPQQTGVYAPSCEMPPPPPRPPSCVGMQGKAGRERSSDAFVNKVSCN